MSKHNYSCVLGLGYGDEAKGRVVDWLCSQDATRPDIVARFSGGQQAAHKVHLTDDLYHIFANFGSGSIWDVPTYWNSTCTFDPKAAQREHKILNEKDIHPKLFVHAKCPVTTPYEVFKNQVDPTNIYHGTTGCGIGATWQREENHYSLLFEDLFYPFVLETKLKLIEESYNFNFKADEIDEFIEACKFATKNYELATKIPDEYKDNILYESSQGVLLDEEHGFFPHVTRSKTDMTVLPYLDHVYLVTRAYQTRHGNGPLSNERILIDIPDNKYEINDSSGLQGKFRKSLLDIDMLQYAMMKSNFYKNAAKTTLVITCLDVIKDSRMLTFNGKIIESTTEKSFINKIKDFLNIENILLSRDVYGDLEKFIN